ncbi:MAG: BrnT family toxin [Candidatus Poribacteria bacterium]|nr:BrnT family toxin [Candidatus Poribacteria bacterium]
MRINGLIWREQVIDKLSWKHNIYPDEVEAVFENAPIYLRKEKGKIEGEDLYNALGQTEAGRYLSAFFIYKRNQRALIVTAREMNAKERRYYVQRKRP